MAQGLDELVEWLVGEVSFYGDGESNVPCPSSMVSHASFTHRIPSKFPSLMGAYGFFWIDGHVACRVSNTRRAHHIVNLDHTSPHTQFSERMLTVNHRMSRV